MTTQIWANNGWKNIKPEDMVNTSRRLQGFCVANGINNRLFYSQGGWYHLQRSGVLVFVIRALYLLSFERAYYILND